MKKFKAYLKKLANDLHLPQIFCWHDFEAMSSSWSVIVYCTKCGWCKEEQVHENFPPTYDSQWAEWTEEHGKEIV